MSYLLASQKEIVNNFVNKLNIKFNKIVAHLNAYYDEKLSLFSKNHSEDEIAIFKVSNNLARQIDIEKVQAKYDKKVAKYNLKFDLAYSKEKFEQNAKEEIAIKELKLELKLSNYKHLLANINNDKKSAKLNKKIDKTQHKLDSFLANKDKYIEKSEKKNLKASKRIWELDFLRGIAIWGMVIDHYIYDFYELLPNIFNMKSSGFLYEMHKFGIAYWSNDFRIFVRLFGVFLFIFLCGISCKFSKNNYKRGFGILLLGGVVTGALGIVSAILKDPSLQIMLATLTTIGLCILIYSLFNALCHSLFGEKSWKWICLSCSLGIFIFWGIFASISYLHPNFNFDYNAHSLYDLGTRFFYIFNNNGNDIGWISSGFSSLTASNWFYPVLGLKGFGADWLGLFPYLGYIFLGGFVGETVYKDRKSIIKYFYHREDRKLVGEQYLASPQGQLNAKLNFKLSKVSYPGQHTLLIYIFHQPAFLVIIIPILLLVGYRLTIF